jgi:DNA mismatch repair ATPase MutL
MPFSSFTKSSSCAMPLFGSSTTPIDLGTHFLETVFKIPFDMSIHALPLSSSVKLSSSQVLLDPSSVVKELIDNAIDACATSIFIEMSSNTLDVIQVKDNGQGINPEDRNMAGKRYCTSKIRTLDDLAEIGGQFLGFRGEALNSLIQLAENVELTTRIDGEATAVKWQLRKDCGSTQ